MADAGPTYELPLDVTEPGPAGPTLEEPLATLETTFAGPTLEGALDVTAAADNLLMEVFDGEAHPSSSQLQVQKDGVAIGACQILSFDESPGVQISGVENAGNESNDVTTLFDGMRLLAQNVRVDALSVGATPVYTTPVGTNLLVEAVVLRCVSADAITGPATARVTTAGGDVFESQVLTGLTQAGRAYLFPQGGSQLVVPPSTVFSVQIDVVAAGTSQTFEADLVGRLFA